MHYDSDGLSNDDDGDDDLDLGGLSDDSDELIDNDRPSEPRSYRSYDELEDDDDLSDRLKRKLNDLTESDSLPRSVRRSRPLANSMDSDPSSPRGTYDEEDSRRTGRRSRSGTDDLDTSAEKRQRRSEDRRRKSLEKKRSFEKRSTDNSLHWRTRKDIIIGDFLRESLINSLKTVTLKSSASFTRHALRAWHILSHDQLVRFGLARVPR